MLAQFGMKKRWKRRAAAGQLVPLIFMGPGMGQMFNVDSWESGGPIINFGKDKMLMDARLRMSGMMEGRWIVTSIHGNEDLRKSRAGDGVGVGAEPDGMSRLMVHHMSDGPASAFDVGNADDFAGMCIEADKAVWG